MSEQKLPPVIKLIAFASVLGAAYQLAPDLLWAVAALVVLYLLLANGGKAADLFAGVPKSLTNIVKPAP